MQNISKLKSNKAPGIDQIPTKYIKMTANIISSFLAEIFNNCIQLGIFPDKLKIAKVTLVYKSGVRELMTNYRPISCYLHLPNYFNKSFLNSYTTI